MPWNPNTFEAVCAGLRKSAAEGQFVPHHWVAHIETNNSGGHCMYGCGWGLVGWFTAIMHGGAGWAKHLLPEDSTQVDVNHVLRMAGLTDAEIDSMEPEQTWMQFDQELHAAYENCVDDWDSYIVKSKDLAEFFISVISTVPCDERTPSKTPYTVMSTTNPTVNDDHSKILEAA